MSDKQTDSELNAWIAVNVFSLHKQFCVMKRGLYYRPNDCGYTDRIEEAGVYTLEEAKEREYLHDEPVTVHPWPVPNYTDPAAAMEVLKRCLDKVKEDNRDTKSIAIWQAASGEFGVLHIEAYADDATLELAIAKFAKQLFTQKAT